MGSSELQEILDAEPFHPLRITVATGTAYRIDQRELANIQGLTLTLIEMGLSGQSRLLFISIPNIVVVEPMFRSDGRLEEV